MKERKREREEKGGIRREGKGGENKLVLTKNKMEGRGGERRGEGKGRGEEGRGGKGRERRKHTRSYKEQNFRRHIERLLGWIMFLILFLMFLGGERRREEKNE